MHACVAPSSLADADADADVHTHVHLNAQVPQQLIRHLWMGTPRWTLVSLVHQLSCVLLRPAGR